MCGQCLFFCITIVIRHRLEILNYFKHFLGSARNVLLAEMKSLLVELSLGFAKELITTSLISDTMGSISGDEEFIDSICFRARELVTLFWLLRGVKKVSQKKGVCNLHRS